MKSVQVVTDYDECRQIWELYIPREQLSDLWEVRDCFQRNYGHTPNFMVCRDQDRVCGFLPLSLNRDTGSFMYYPGETWEGKTWLEQNRILVDDRQILKYMLGIISGPYALRYLQCRDEHSSWGQVPDEIGYYFLPPQYGFDMNNYYREFSSKSLKRIRREIEKLKDRGLDYSVNRDGDFSSMVEMNMSRYGSLSYFLDARFLKSFEQLFELLQSQGLLRMVAVEIAGRIAAVDMGCVYNNTYTLLAGGTHADFPGIAKLINLHHMEWACENRVERVDFLCGDFNWKKQFHLTERPLYLLAGQGAGVTQHVRFRCTDDIPRTGVAAGSVNRV